LEEQQEQEQQSPDGAAALQMIKPLAVPRAAPPPL